jgi:diguanylate cyclase (GGDEF)-like protein
MTDASHGRAAPERIETNSSDSFQDNERVSSARVRGRWIHRLTEPQILFPILAVLALSGLWLVTLNLIRVERENAHRTARVISQELLETYEAQVVRVLREIDQTLKSLQYVHQITGDGQATLDRLDERDLLPPNLVFQVSITDSNGSIVATTGESPRPPLDPDFVRLAGAADVVTEDRPVRIGDDWWLRFSRPLQTADGSFDGLALVEVEASFFVSGYEAAKLGSHGVIALLGSDGVFRVRRSGDEVSVGDSISFVSVVTGDGLDETEALLSVNKWDGVRRYTSARQLYDFPLAVVAGLSLEEQLESANLGTDTYVYRTAAVSVLLLLGLAILGRLSWRLESMRQREREYRAAYAQQVEHLAYHDALTGLPNRSFLGKLLGDRIRQSTRYNRRFALLCLDLDGFKLINDTLGHDAGDDLLREVANRLEDTLRKSDTVARMGGDEFTILLPEIESESQAGTVATNIVSSLAEPFVLLGEKFCVTASVGISIFPIDGEDEQTLMKNADIAMYAAKDAGKNAFRFFSAAMSNASQERINLESGLRDALANEEFELHYQTRMDLHTSRTTGIEALLRWNHPELGILGPNKFLPLAEETGLIIPIGRWVLRTACRQNLEWREQGLPHLCVAVNLSARQFLDPNLTSDVSAILEEYDMPPELLELEISETVLARDTRKSLPVLQRLKQLGVRITVDNFGTSYTTLSVLGELPFDTIKIDRLFMREDSGDSAAREVINGILTMGRALSASVIAHGVETQEQLEFLRAQVCDQVQGFYFGQPFKADEVVHMLHAMQTATGAASLTNV